MRELIEKLGVNIAASMMIAFLLPTATHASLIITEVYPAPTSGNDEWVEIYNDSSTDEDLTTYKIYDIAGNELAFEETVLPGEAYALATAKGVINNSGDTIFLSDSFENIVDSVTTPSGISSDESYSYCENDSAWKITTEISKGTKNDDACAIPTSTVTPSPSLNPTTSIKPSPTSKIEKKSTTTPEPDKKNNTTNKNTGIPEKTNQDPQPVLFSDIHPVVVESKSELTPTPKHSRKTLSITEHEKPPFMPYVKLGTFVSFLSCSANFVYSINKYTKNL